MRPARLVLLLPLLALAACQTPREACVSEALGETRVIDALIAQTQGNLARGYAIEEDQEVRVVPTTCRDDDDDGHRSLFCERTEVRDVERAVAVDLRAEQAKLDGLLERRAGLEAGRANALAACQALLDA